MRLSKMTWLWSSMTGHGEPGAGSSSFLRGPLLVDLWRTLWCGAQSTTGPGGPHDRPLVSAHWTQREAPRPRSNRAMAGEVCAELGLCANCEVLMKDPDKGTGDVEMMWVVTGRGNRAFFSLWNKPQPLADPNRKLNQPSKWVLDIWFLCSWEPQVKRCLL